MSPSRFSLHSSCSETEVSDKERPAVEEVGEGREEARAEKEEEDEIK